MINVHLEVKINWKGLSYTYNCKYTYRCRKMVISTLIDKTGDIFVSPSSVLRKEDLSRSTFARLRTGVRWSQESTPFRQDTTNHPQFSCSGSAQYMQRRDWPEPQQSEWVICCLCPDVSEFLSAFSYLLVRMVSNPIHTPLGRGEKKGRGGGMIASCEYLTSLAI